MAGVFPLLARLSHLRASRSLCLLVDCQRAATTILKTRPNERFSGPNGPPTGLVSVRRPMTAKQIILASGAQNAPSCAKRGACDVAPLGRRASKKK